MIKKVIIRDELSLDDIFSRFLLAKRSSRSYEIFETWLSSKRVEMRVLLTIIWYIPLPCRTAFQGNQKFTTSPIR